MTSNNLNLCCRLKSTLIKLVRGFMYPPLWSIGHWDGWRGLVGRRRLNYNLLHKVLMVERGTVHWSTIHKDRGRRSPYHLNWCEGLCAPLSGQRVNWDGWHGLVGRRPHKVLMVEQCTGQQSTKIETEAHDEHASIIATVGGYAAISQHPQK